MVERRRVSLLAVVERHHLVHRDTRALAPRREIVEAPLDHLFLSRPLGALLVGGLDALGEVSSGRGDAEELGQVGVVVLGLGPAELLGGEIEQALEAPRRDRELMLVVAKDEGAPLAREDELPVLQRFPVLLAEDGQEDAGVEALFPRLPVDVEDVGVARRGAVLEDVVPQRVLSRRDAHVIGDEVDQQPEPPAPRASSESARKPWSPPSSGFTWS